MKQRHKATALGLLFVGYTLLVASMFYFMGAADSMPIDPKSTQIK